MDVHYFYCCPCWGYPASWHRKTGMIDPFFIFCLEAKEERKKIRKGSREVTSLNWYVESKKVQRHAPDGREARSVQHI